MVVHVEDALATRRAVMRASWLDLITLLASPGPYSAQIGHCLRAILHEALDILRQADEAIIFLHVERALLGSSLTSIALQVYLHSAPMVAVL